MVWAWEESLSSSTERPYNKGRPCYYRAVLLCHAAKGSLWPLLSQLLIHVQEEDLVFLCSATLISPAPLLALLPGPLSLKFPGGRFHLLHVLRHSACPISALGFQCFYELLLQSRVALSAPLNAFFAPPCPCYYQLHELHFHCSNCKAVCSSFQTVFRRSLQYDRHCLKSHRVFFCPESQHSYFLTPAHVQCQIVSTAIWFSLLPAAKSHLLLEHSTNDATAWEQAGTCLLFTGLEVEISRQQWGWHEHLSHHNFTSSTVKVALLCLEEYVIWKLQHYHEMNCTAHNCCI